MKVLLFLILIGTIEIYLVANLHDLMGMRDLILLYLGTTFIGLALAWLVLPVYREHKNRRGFSNKFNKRLKSGSLSKKDIKNVKSWIYCMSYWFGCIFVAIPGITTDIIGLFLLLPPVGNFISEQFSEDVLKRYTSVE